MELFDCLVYFALIGVLFFWVGRLLARRWRDPEAFPYRCFRFEREGKIYERIKIKDWQNRLPDMSRLMPGVMPAKKLEKAFSSKTLGVMVQETCVAELIHGLLCIAGLFCLRIWKGIGGVLLYAAYVLLGNLPYMLIQRYNRPKLCRLQRRLEKREREKTHVRVDSKL